MSKPTTRALTLSKQLMQGIIDARNAHQLMSMERFGLAPEYLVTTKIAEALSEKYSRRVCLEQSVGKALSLSSHQIEELPPELRGNRRADLFLRWKNESPRAIIEVKHPGWAVPKLMEDVRRIAIALTWKRDTKQLSIGCLVFYAQTPKSKTVKDKLTAKACLDKRLDCIWRQATKELKDRGCKVMQRRGDLYEDPAVDDTRWGMPYCLVIKRTV